MDITIRRHVKEYKLEEERRKFTAEALPLSNHCLPESFFSFGAVRADSGIILQVIHIYL